MASTKGSRSDAMKAVYDAVYEATLAGKQLSTKQTQKIYDDVAGTAKKSSTVPTNAAYNQINARTGKNPLENNAALDILKGQTSATTSSPFSTLFNKSAQNANTELRKEGIYAPEFLTVEDFKTTQKKQADAQKAYDDYVNSDTYKNKQAAGAIDTSALFSDNVPSQRKVHDEKEAELRAVNDYYKRQVQAEEDQKVMETDLAELATWSEEDRRNLDQYIAERSTHAINALNPMLGTQIDTYNMNPIVSKYGIDKVRQMAESVQRSKNAELMQQVQKLAADTANNRPVLGGIGGSIASIPATLAGSVTSPLMYAAEVGQRTGRYSTLDPNNIGNLPSAYAETVRSEVAQNIRGEGENNNWMRELAAIGYQGGMSALDSAARMVASGGSAGVSAAIASSGAFGSTLRSASQQGAAPAQAAAMALVDAGLEYVTEKIPTEQVLDMFKKGDNTSAVKNVLKQAFLVEPTSEEVNLFAGVAAETLILGDKSSNHQRLGELIANGMSYQEAKAQIYKELWKEAAQTYAVSAFSGGLSAAGATIAGDVVNRPQQEATQQTEAAAPLQQEAKSAEDVLAEAVGAELAQNAPAPAPAQPMTEQQQHLENGIAATLGVENKKPAERISMEDFANNKKDAPLSGGRDGLDNRKPAGASSDASTNIMGNENAEVKGIGAAEENFSGKAQYQDLLYEGNVQPDREGDVRPMEVPIKDSYDRNVSEFVANAYGAKVTSDRMANEIEMLVQEGALGFDKRSNQDALNDAAAEIETKGAATIRNQITRNVANGRIKDGDIEKAMLLYASYANKNGARAQADAAEIMVDLTTMAHMTGRNLQLFKLLRKLTPEGQLMAIKQNVQRNVENMKRAGLVKKDFEADIDSDLMNEYKAAVAENARAVTDEQKQQSEQKMRELQEAIYAKAAAEMPATFKAKWDAWRYMAMLCNAKTQARNFGGNAAMIPYKEVKDRMAALFEKAFVSKDKRTKSLLTDPKLVAWAKEDLKTEDVQNALKYSAKIGDDATNAKFSEGKKVFDNKALEAVRKFSEKVPQAGDMIFKNGYYARTLADFLRARGYTAEDVQSGKVSEAVLNEGRGYAVEEAMKATFNDSNAFSDMISSMRFKEADNVWKKAANIAGEGVLPFRRTPANIMVRFAEYSPAGLAKGVWDMATKVRNGDLSAAAALDEIAAGVTGSAAMALGYFMAKGIAGVKLTGGKLDEDEERQGHQKYAIEFMIDGKEYSYKIDWAAPANMPLFVGANIYDMLENAGQDTDVSFITSFIHGMGTMFEPILALSCMSSLNEVVEGVRYAGEGEAIYSLAVDIATSYFMQGIPALLRQTYTATQKNKQTTFANSDDPTIRDLQNLGAQIPFAAKNFQTDKRNAWGETQDMGNAVTRAANAYLNPGTFKQIENNAVEQELARLKEAQTESVSPPDVKKTISYTDKNGEEHKSRRLTEEEYQKLAEAQGKTAKEVLNKLVESSDYKALTDAQKAKVVGLVYDYAREHGRVEAIADYKGYSDSWMQNISGKEAKTIVNKVVAAEMSDSISAITNAWSNKWDAAESVEALDAAYEVYHNMSQTTRNEIKKDSSGRMAAYLEARSSGVKTETFVDLYKTYWELDKSSKKVADKANQWAYTLERAQESGKINERQQSVLKDALGFRTSIPVDATKFDEMTESGLTAKAAQETVKAIGNLLPEDGYKNVRDIQNWDAIAAMTISDTEKVAAMKAYMSDTQEAKLDEVLGMGYSPEQYTQIWRIVDGYTSGTGKKKRTIAYMQNQFGISYNTAKTLYEVFK